MPRRRRLRGQCAPSRLGVWFDPDGPLASDARDALFIGDADLTTPTFSLNREMRSLPCSLRRLRPQMGPVCPPPQPLLAFELASLWNRPCVYASAQRLVSAGAASNYRGLPLSNGNYKRQIRWEQTTS